MNATQLRTRNASCLVFALLFTLVAVGLPADRLELRNGDTITGTIQLMDAEKVIIQTEYGLLELDRSAILRGEFGVDDGEVTDSLVFHFDFSGSVEDSTGNHRATNNGMRFVADRAGAPASALRSDGNGTYLSIAPHSELNNLDEFTLAFRVQLEDLSTTQYLFSKWDRAEGETAEGKFTLQAAGGNLTAYFVDSTGMYHWLVARGVLEEMAWHAIAVTFSGGRAAIYVDGVSVASERFDFASLYADASPILVMTAEYRGDDPFSYHNAVGSLDDLRLYSRALSPEEVALLADVRETQ